MILSMTGFVTSTVEISLGSSHEPMIVNLSMKSLNSRFFEISCKVPTLLSNLEIPAQRLLQKKLHRGHVSLFIKISNSNVVNETVKPALHTIQNYLDAIAIIKDTFTIQENVTLAQILQIPNIFEYEELQINTDIEHAVLQAIDDLANKLIESQHQEGLQLGHDIEKQLASMKIKIDEIQKISQQLIQEKKDALHDIVSDLSNIEKTEEKTTEQCLLEAKKTTLMYEIEKIDINEETVRFNSHLQNVAAQCKSSEPVKGKKIDFIIQELNREINTIAAKCSNIDISRLAIDIKSELEKAREQAQNII